MTKYEKKSKFLNEVAFYAMFVCDSKPCKEGYIEPFRVRFLKVQKWVRYKYISLIVRDIKVKW